MAEKKTYDLTGIALDPNGEHILDEKKDKSTSSISLKNMVIRAFKMRTSEERIEQENLEFHRKIVRKLEKSDGVVSFNSRAIEAIKKRVRDLYHPCIAMQISEVFDGDVSDAALEDI